MHGASCLTQIEGYVYRCSYGNITTNTKSSRVCTLWLITLFNLLLCCNIPTNVEANDIQLSGLSQSPSNPVSEGTSVSYSLTTRNVDDGINESSSVGISIRMRVDGAVIRADSGDIEAAGCSIDQNYPDYFACNDLLEGGTQTPSFTWSNPSPGNHSVVFEAACQWIPAQTPPAYCTSFGTSISTSTTIGAYPISNAGSGSLITLDAGANDALDVTLDGSASSDPDGNIVTYQWLEGDNEIATGATPTLNLSAGDHRLTLRVTDNHGLSDDDSITYRILSDPTAHTTSQAFVESDGDGLENVTLDGSSSQDPGGNIVTYEWFESGTLIATGATPAIDLALGTHYITLRVTDNDGATNEAQAEITILPYPSTRFADAGPDQYLIDTDNNSSEIVQLDATGSGNYGNATYYWYEQTELVAVGITPRVTLPVGIHTLFLEVEVFTPDGELGANDGDEVTITVLAATEAPIANAGEDQTLTDADADGSEEVTLDATGSSYAAGNSVSYQWLENGTEIATGATPTVTLSVGSHTLTLRLTDSNNLSSEDQVVISVAAASSAPIANAGQNQVLIDTDSNGSEQVTLDGTGSSDADGTIVSYQWFENGTEIASGASPTLTLPLGVHTLTLRVTDNDDLAAEDQLVISIVTNTDAPIANAGANQALVDTDGDGSVSVTLDGADSTDPDGRIVTYQWLEGSNEIATGITPTVVLSLGVHTLTLRVTDNDGLTNQDQVTVTIRREENQLQIISGSGLTGSAGDTVGPFSVILVDQSGTPVADRTIVWHVTPVSAATLSETESTTDQEGHASTSMTIQQTGVIKLTATSANLASIEFIINSIAETPGLTKEQQPVGITMDNLCPSLAEKQNSGNLSMAEQDLLMTCDNLVTEPGVGVTLSRLAPEEVAAQGTASIEAASTQLTNINTRLVALRSGDLGMNLSGLTVNYGGIAFTQKLFEGMFIQDKKARGGAAGDIDELQGRWGAFINGNINFGEKDKSEREAGFDFDTRGITMGLDYRFNERLIAGGALGFSRYDSDYNDAAGNLNMDAWNLSAYGTYYNDNNIYVDGLIQIGSNRYDTRRRINASGEPDQFGQGDTNGMEYALNLSAGYEYRRDALILTPYGRLSYTRAQIDAYTEKASNPGTAGFGSILHIDDQELKSIVFVVGGNFSYTLSTTSAVLMPQLRFEWEHEFEDDARYINARFINDPTQSGFSIETDEADRNYFNLGIGLSANFAQGRSGYLFYETRLDQDNVTLHRIDAGLRIEF